MKIDIEVPELADLIERSSLNATTTGSAGNRAIIEALYFEEGDPIEEDDVFAEIRGEHFETFEVRAPASGTISYLRHHEGDTVTSEEVLATIDVG